jgi:deoxyribose-phosphate aldolase
LNHEQKELGCRLAVNAGADFVKTSTGFSTGGATVEDVQLMRRIVGNRVGVKASGGVRSAEQMRAMVTAGANRIGTSSGVAILRELGNNHG